jgi:hypothetical protein
MASKKQRRTEEVRTRKKKKGWRNALLALIAVALVGLLIFFFVTLFDALFPPSGKGTAKKEKREVVLYFSDANERFLVPEKRFVAKEASDEEQAREIVKALVAGSKAGNVATLPEKAEVQGVRIRKDGTAEVSFGRALVSAHPGSTASEAATVQSLANTLSANIPAVKRVQILADGKEMATIRGHLDTRKPFAPKDLTAPGARP